MKRTLTIKGRTGLFDIPSFIISENQNLKIAIKFATPMRAERYKLVVKHGDLLKTYGVVYDNAITIPAEWIKQNNENLEFSLVFLDEKGIRVIKDDFEIEPLLVEHLEGNFTFTAMVQQLITWQKEHGAKLDTLEKRYNAYESNGVTLDLE